MNTMLDSMIKKIETQAYADDPEALAQASKLIEKYPGEMEVWLLRAYIFAREGNLTNAIDDLTKALELNPTEPCLLFDRGRYYARLGDHQRATEDFTKGIAACDLHSRDYYRQALHFHRAYSYLKLGNKTAAIDDLKKVRDGFTFWTNELCTKEGLLEQCL
jgi:tetratricopeptide (TPR) repeat protein